jgi:hypothetical protein
LTGKPIVVAKKLLGLGAWGQCFPAPEDLDNTLVTLATTATGGGDPHPKVVGIVENGLAGHKIQLAITVIEGRHESALPTPATRRGDCKYVW